MLRRGFQITGSVGVLITLFALQSSRGLAQDPTLTELRNDFAMGYLEPAPHMALAKYYLDHGNRLLAFYILEAARRGRFEEKVFNRAFHVSIRGMDDSESAEAAILKELSGNPQSQDLIFKLADLYIAREDWVRAKQYLAAGIKNRPDDLKFTTELSDVLEIEGNTEEAQRLVKDFVARFPQSEAAYGLKIENLIETSPAKAKPLVAEARAKFPKSGAFELDLGRILQNEGKLVEAEQSFIKAAELSPDSPDIQAWTGRFLYKVRKDNARALEYYLNAYFLNPHTYESEFVESRVQSISADLAKAEIEKRVKAGTPLEGLLSDANPAVVELALERIAENWKAAYLEPVLKCLEHDDEAVRWAATETIKRHVDQTFDEKLKALLSDNDLRKRGSAAYIAVHLWKQKRFEVIRSMLKQPSELVRYDAISALILEGGNEGRKIAFAHATAEPNPALKKLIESAKQEKH